jgi:hypothetical protein
LGICQLLEFHRYVKVSLVSKEMNVLKRSGCSNGKGMRK